MGVNVYIVLNALQQHLPFTVLKLLRNMNLCLPHLSVKLQQHLPFTVLKPLLGHRVKNGINQWSCNSTYRLRY